MQYYPLGSSYLAGKSVKHKLIELFVFDYGSLPYLLSLVFWLGITFPLFALDRIISNSV